MSWNEGLPFFLGAASQVPGIAIQKLTDQILRKDYRIAMSDSSKNRYVLPPNFQMAALSRRWSRDTDALNSVTFSASVLTAGVVLLDPGSVLFAIAIGLGCLLPIASFAAIMTVTPQQYFNLTNRGITPFTLCAVAGSSFVGFVAVFLA